MTIPMIVGQMGASILIGALISKSGKWKGFMLIGSLLVVAGSYLMTTAQLRHRLPLGQRLHVRARRGPRHGHAEPHARRAERHSALRSWASHELERALLPQIAGTIGVTIMGSLLARRSPTHITCGA